MQIRELKVVYGDHSTETLRELHSASDVAGLFRYLRDEPKEQFWVALMNNKHCVISKQQISVGTLSTSLVHPREVFQAAIMTGAAAILLVHNHPSGECTPSPEDDAVTTRLKSAGTLLGIPVLDHLIIGSDSFHSYTSGYKSPY